MGKVRMFLVTNFVALLVFLMTFGGEVVVEGIYIPPGPKWKCPLPTLVWPCQCHSPSDDGISLNCKDVSLATLSAALAYPLSQHVPINLLNLTLLNTKKLYGPIFAGLNASKILIQSSPLKHIYSDVFFNARGSLKELSLVDTQLEEFPSEAFQDLELLESLTIDGHRISSLGGSSKISGLPALKNLRISNGNISSFEKDTFASLATKLVRLDLHGNAIGDIPKDAFQNMKSLEYLDLAFNNLTKLDPSYFFHLHKLTWFNGSHNAIPEFRRGAFARNGFLRVLFLTHNKITKIDAAAFRGMRLLVRLYLADNQITEVGRAAFNSLQKIRTIDLARNQLSLVDFQMFLKLPFCEEIFLQENNITAIKAGSFNELTQVLVNVSHNALASVEKGSFTNVVNITVLDMSYNNLVNFSRGAFDEVSYADEWRLDHNLLQLTTDIPLKFMNFIRILNVSHNVLRDVGKNTFPKLYELHTVDLSHNNLSKIHSGVLGNLFGLRTLNLRYNNMSELTGSTLGTLPTVLELWMDHNRLEKVSNAAFSKLVSMRSLSVTHNALKKVFQIPGSLNDLNLAHNKISSLAKVWPDMNALQRLDLSHNELGELEPGSFSGLAPLSWVNLAHNGIKAVPAEALSDLRTCQHIDLSHNSIDTLEKGAFGRLPVVFTLLLSHNNISTIAPRAFDGLLQLLHVDLSSNNLGSIPGGAFSNLVALRTLNLSHNDIQRTENGTNCLFEDTLSLLTLDLSFNSISSISPNSFPQAQWTNYKLAHLNLSHNSLPIVAKDILRGTRTLVSLDLSHNRITEIKPNLLQNLGLLETLDISHNVLHSLDNPAVLGPPPKLKDLNLEGNQLRRFPTSLLPKAPLTLLNLKNNRIRLYAQEFTPKVKNGSLLLLNGNQVSCTCELVILKRFFEGERPELTNYSSSFFQSYENFECGANHLKLKTLQESQLPCDYSEDPLAVRLVIEKAADIGIRSLLQSGSNVQLRWWVTSKKDILGFVIFLLGEDSKVVKSQMFGYHVRAAGIDAPRSSVQACVAPNFSSKENLVSGVVDEGLLKDAVCQLLDTTALSKATSKGSHLRAFSLSLLLFVGVVLSHFKCAIL